jgi:uncharacterized protein (PEP-CTERM system associated)
MHYHAMTAGRTPSSRPGRGRLLTVRTGVLGSPVLGSPVLGLAALVLVMQTGGAAAFPLLDTTNLDQVPRGTELAAPDLNDLQHQLQLVNGLGAPAGGGWTFVPRIDWQEELTDNALEANSPRRADLVTFVSPGISVAGDLPRVQATFDFAPTLAMYARTSNLNALTMQMNGLASVTLVPDLAFVDIRGVSGVNSQFGGLGGLGGVGAPSGAAATAQTSIPNLAGNGAGLNRDNEVQTTSIGISPYLLRQFGDWGTAKLGYSLGVTESDTLSGFASPPIPTGGANAQTLVSNEEIAQFTTGDFMQFFKDSVNVDLQQTRTTTGTNGATIFGGIPAPPGVSTTTRTFVSNTVSYPVTRDLTVSVSGGHEDITFTNQNAGSVTSATTVFGPNGVAEPPTFTFANTASPPVHDLTWSLGATWVPNPDSSLSVSYGHQNGFNSLTANGFYALTARTQLTVSYGSTLGTQLENVQNQLNLAGTNGTGTLVNGQTGGSLFGSTNALPVQEGVFKTTTLNVGSQTTLDRDIISVNFQMTKQTNSGGNSSSADSKSATVSWLHEMRPDMTVNGAISYAIQDQTTGTLSVFNPGNNTSIVASLAWQWQISDTLSTNLRYSFFERQSAATTFDLYQNILILGISKRF